MLAAVVSAWEGQMRRRDFAAIPGAFALLAAWPRALRAQPAPKPKRIGFLALGIGPATRIADAFREGLREHGYVLGTNATLDYRFAEGQAARLAGLAAELVRLEADVIVVESFPAALAAKRATSTIPIITAVVSDPVSTGLVRDLARPGGNITGISNIPSQLITKRLELLKRVAAVTVVGVVWNPLNPAARGYLDDAHAAAKALGLALVVAEARGADDFDAAFARILAGRVHAFTTLPDGMIWNNRRRVAEFALGNKLPSVFDAHDFAEAGGLLVYGPSLEAMFRRSAAYVDKVLKGADPATLPFELPTKFELVVNLKIAKELGLTIPDALLVSADEVIE
jgi:putative ABC transport system substrate-binding protein